MFENFVIFSVAVIILGALGFILQGTAPKTYRLRWFPPDGDGVLTIRTDWNIRLTETSRFMDSKSSELSFRITANTEVTQISVIFEYDEGISGTSQNIRLINNGLGSLRYFLYFDKGMYCLEEVML